MYILSTGCQWRAIPKDLPPRSTLYDYFDLWSWDGTLDRIHHELYVKCREAVAREASPTAAVIDSQSVKSAEKGGRRSTSGLRRGKEDQGQEAAHSRRHPRPADPRHRARRRHSGSRWWRVGDGDDVRPVSVPAETLCRWRLSRPGVPSRCEQNHGASECRDRQALGPRQRLCRAAKAMGGRTHIRMARALSTARQGLENLNRKALAFLRLASIRLMLRKLCNPV